LELILPVLNTSWPNRSGKRTYSSFLNKIRGPLVSTEDTWNRMALEPMSIAANFMNDSKIHF
jgi:hypothetical protein